MLVTKTSRSKRFNQTSLETETLIIYITSETDKWQEYKRHLVITFLLNLFFYIEINKHDIQ